MEVPNADFVGYLAGSLNPQDPFVYYSTQRSDQTRNKRQPFPSNVLGRINVATMEHGGQIGSTSEASSFQANELVLSFGGELIYVGKSGGFRVGKWTTTTGWDGRNVQNVLPSEKATYGNGCVPDPFGQMVAQGSFLYTPHLLGCFGKADYEPKAFFHTQPLAIGVSKNGLVIGSTNTFLPLHTMD